MLKRFMPKSLYGRVALIVVLPIFLTQAVVTYVFFDRHWDTVTANQSANVAGQIAFLTDLYQRARSPEARAKMEAMALAELEISTRFEPGKKIPERNKLSPFNLYNATLDRQLEEKLDEPFWFDTKSWPFYIEIRVETEDGYLAFLPFRDRVFATTGPVFLLWLFGTSLLLGAIAIVFMRNQVRSILRLAAAAEAFGRGRDMPGFRPSGATEVRRAGRAFIAMRERIRRHLDQRATMLAGVSHDLRTPLTRMKLALAFLPETDESSELKRDVAEMESMIDAYLDFASDISSAGEPERFDVADLVREVAETADEARIEVDAAHSIAFEGRRDALKRAVANLVGNGLKYATHVWINVRRVGNNVEIAVDDDGPGVPAERREEVFKPFFRLDGARSRHEGAGLGLTIVREVARGHGGEILLSDSPRGGLRAVLKLPA